MTPPSRAKMISQCMLRSSRKTKSLMWKETDCLSSRNDTLVWELLVLLSMGNRGLCYFLKRLIRVSVKVMVDMMVDAHMPIKLRASLRDVEVL